MTGPRELPPPIPWWQRPKKLAGRVRRRFGIDRYDVFARSVPNGEIDLDLPSEYAIGWAEVGLLERCDPYHTELDERERALGKRRLDFGHRLVAVTASGLPVFTMWVNPRNLNVPGLIKRRLPPGRWFIYKAFTSPEHRRRGLYEAGMRFVLREMRGAGLEELLGYAHVKKRVSRRGLARIGFHSRGTIVQVRAPGFAWTRVSRELLAALPQPAPRSGVLDGLGSEGSR